MYVNAAFGECVVDSAIENIHLAHYGAAKSRYYHVTDYLQFPLIIMIFWAGDCIIL